jgi:hypothetical protein
MDNFILELGSNVNVLPRQMWEIMEKPNVVSLIFYLRMENQHKIVLIGSLVGVNFNIDGVCNITDFEVIEIMDNSYSYLALIEMEWAFENHNKRN